MALPRKHIAYRKIVTTAALLGLVVFSGFILHAKLHRSTYASNLSSGQQNIKQIRDDLGRILEPKDIETGQKDLSAQFIVAQLENMQKAYPTLQLPAAVSVCASTLPDLTCNDYVRAKTHSTASVADVRIVLAYHHQIMKSLQSVLEYNPEADLGDEGLNQPVIDGRIKAASDGLDKTRRGLLATDRLKDDQKSALVEIIEKLQQQLALLEKSRDKSAWYTAVADAQAAILKNRQTFWQERLSETYESLDLATSELSHYSALLTR